MPTRNYLKTFNATCVVLGLSSVHSLLQKSSKYRIGLVFVPILAQIGMVIMELYISTIFHHELFHTGSFLNALADAIQVGGILFASSMYFLENLLKGRLDTNLRQMMYKLDCEIFALCPDKSVNRKLNLNRFFLTKLFYLVGFGLCVDICLMTTIRDDEKYWRQNICVRAWSNNMLRIGLLRIIIYFGWVTSRLCFIQRELKKQLRLSVATPKAPKLNESLRKITELKRIYGSLWSFVQLLNERYSWTLFCVMTFYFCSICVGLYFLLMRIQFQRFRTMPRKDFSNNLSFKEEIHSFNHFVFQRQYFYIVHHVL